MSDEEEFGSIGEEAIDALYDTGYAVGALVSGEPEVAVDHFLDASSSALDAITDGGFSHLVDRFEEDTGIDTREVVQDGLEYVGEAIGDAAWEATEFVGEVYDDVSDVASDVYDEVSDVASDVYDTASDAYDAVGDAASDAYDTVAGWLD
jgi:hypothetical protein